MATFGNFCWAGALLVEELLPTRLLGTKCLEARQFHSAMLAFVERIGRRTYKHTLRTSKDAEVTCAPFSLDVSRLIF